MPLLPFRLIFRSRWAAIIWAAGICWTAASFAGRDTPNIDAANASDGSLAQASALLAEE